MLLGWLLLVLAYPAWGLFMLLYMRFFPFLGLVCSEESVPLHLPFMFTMLRSKEPVPSAGACNVLLVSSLYCKLVLLFFDLYISYI